MSQPAQRVFLKGNEAVCYGAIEAGCRHYFGYPITPQSEIPALMSKELPKCGGQFLQAESEIASINMLLGASACGVRAMTSSSSPGISLKQEGISYMAGSELPGLIVNISRSGPGLGGIDASQGDYFQAVKGGGHGDYRIIVLAPHSVQEMYDLTMHAFDLSDRYRMPAMLLGDSLVGQMKEAIELRPRPQVDLPAKDWAVTGKGDRSEQRIVKSLFLGDGELEAHNRLLQSRADALRENEVMAEEVHLEDAELVLVAFGAAARIAKTAVKMAREEGLKVGMLRPITLFPYPEQVLAKLAERARRFLCIELNTGQMVDDVRLAVNGRREVLFYGRPPGTGSLPNPEEILDRIRESY